MLQDVLAEACGTVWSSVIAGTCVFFKKFELQVHSLSIFGVTSLRATRFIYKYKINLSLWKLSFSNSSHQKYMDNVPFTCIVHRKITSVDDMFKEICNHIKEASNNGVIIPMITVFPQRQPNGKDILKLWNQQLIAYAGLYYFFYLTHLIS